jgi:hypothetical protein
MQEVGLPCDANDRKAGLESNLPLELEEVTVAANVPAVDKSRCGREIAPLQGWVGASRNDDRGVRLLLL